LSEIPWHRCPIFASLSEGHRATLERLVSVREIGKGEFLFHEGEPCNGFYVLMDGAVMLSRFGSADGRETPLHQVLPGQSFAEAALFGGMPFPATAAVTAASRVAFVPGPPFLAMLRDHPDLALALLASQAKWLQRLVTRLSQLGTQDAESRLREWLRDSAGGTGTVRIQGTKKSLAAQLGMSPETFSRTLAAMREKGLVEVRGPVVHLKGRL
jgi:CRP/FNR family transcriptional regulator